MYKDNTIKCERQSIKDMQNPNVNGNKMKKMYKRVKTGSALTQRRIDGYICKRKGHIGCSVSHSQEIQSHNDDGHASENVNHFI